MADEGPPRSFPLMSLEELRSRSYLDSPHFAYNRASVPLRSRPTSRARRPRLLACHDLAGGYLDDQWVQGSPNSCSYTLTRWRLLDCFVYFSHNLVTLPPPGWTNAAHLHGVQVLGTFITEWAAGADVCKELLESEESARMYAECLAELAEELGFDGWLINIENAIAPLQLGNLIEFVRRLSTSMHSLVPESLVIWYDSVTVDGKLNWQDCLNRKNKPFFDVCDGIFTNYAWKKDYPKQSATAASDRAYDVYMGVDVFGRNTFGGGGYQSDAALTVAHDAGVSAALFAPAWSYETNQDQERWWSTIENCWPVARPDPVQLPFFTDFDDGKGIANFLEGHKESDLPWSNLSCQNLQPFLRVAQSTRHRLVASTRFAQIPAPEAIGPTISNQESFCYGGGKCIEVIGDVDRDEVSIVLLYRTDRIIEEISLVVSYSVMTEGDSSFCLALSVVEENGEKVIFCLLDRTGKGSSALAGTRHRFAHTSIEFVGGREVSDRGLWNTREFYLRWGKYALVGVFGVCSRATDVQRLLIDLVRENEGLFDGEEFVRREGAGDSADIETMDTAEGGSSMPGVEEKTAAGRNAHYFARLGHISIASSGHEHSTSADMVLMGHRPSWLVGDGGNRFLSVTLRWDHDLGLGHSGLEESPAAAWAVLDRYHLYVVAEEGLPASPPPTYLGTTMLNCFYAYMFPVPRAAQALTFRLRLQCPCGVAEPLSYGASYTVQVPSLQTGHFVKTQPSLSDWLFR